MNTHHQAIRRAGLLAAVSAGERRQSAFTQPGAAHDKYKVERLAGKQPTPRAPKLAEENLG